jgi:asparagine synthase (glutamine-hydrolysing)
MNIVLSKLPWNNNDKIWVTGFIRIGDKYLAKDELLNYFAGIDTIEKFEQTLKNANGQFSVIKKSSGEIWAATDRLRNYPLFYTLINGHFTICDDCNKLIGLQPEKRFNPNAFDCFLSSGYVINNLTLIDNVFQVEAGEFVILGDCFSRKFYYDPNDVVTIEKDFKTAADELNNVISNVFKNHFKALSNDFIAIALSGGFDSRLIASMCAKYHPENVICYTYGVRDNLEVELAKQVAERLGIKWINIVYDSELIEGFLNDDIFKEYYPFASNLSSMFFLQEYFAVKYLKENKLVPDNCVFIQGHSGDMLAGGHLTPAMKNKMDKSQLGNLIFSNYFGLIKLNRQKELNIIELIRAKIPETNYETWKVLENWDQKERQAKFIVNSSKVFSFFGYNYVLPLFDNLFLDFFSNLQFQYKLNKNLYDYVLTKYVFNDINLNFSDELNPSPSRKSFQRFKEKIKAFLPYKVKNLFIKHQSHLLQEEITGLMIENIGPENIIHPRQSNYFNSFMTQWYLFKTRDILNDKEKH